MSGNRIGGKKAANTNKERYGQDFYKVQGAKGGSKSSDGGFGSSLVDANGLTGKERASIYGARGGRKSRRGPAKLKEEVQPSDAVLRSINLDLEEQKQSRLISDLLGRLTGKR